ncbi:hypothetical protein C8J57DRAFT_1314510 [Mycena rebaudengoi]|nr:hypothetical protein C8J57DRAFT_1314510 [Mycena rebaudengoi]
MGNTLTKSPQELALATIRVTEKQRQLILEPTVPPPPPGYVRVQFYTHLFKIYDRSPPDIVSDIPLNRSGGLDLISVKRLWGLETCLPVDPLRWKPFQPTHTNYLSAVAIRVLSEGEGCINFIEPTVSHQTLIQRQTRCVVSGLTTVLSLTCLRGVEMVVECLEADTPLPALYRRLRRSVKRRTSRIQMLEWQEILNILILFAWIFLVFGSLTGYVQFAPRERGRKWVRTGSFSL